MEIFQRIKRLETWLERIGDSLDRPMWNGDTFVYKQVTPKHVAYLKAVRAVSSLHSLPLLYGKGLFVDGGTIVRCINEALSEIFFVLEKYPSTSSKIDKFARHFVATFAPGDNKENPPIASRKIHSAEARVFQHQLNFNDALKKIRNIYEIFSGYVHSKYPHIMEIYGGQRGNLRFNVSGVGSVEKKLVYAELVEETIKSTELAVGFIAFRLGLNDLFLEIRDGLI